MVSKEMMSDTKLIKLQSVNSTNSYLKQLIANGDPTLCEGMTVAAVAQTAGRGQKGNSWEAEPGCNVTLSILIEPTDILPSKQFAISEVVALATAFTVDLFLPDGMQAQVKWPNDIYVGNRKIAGILIENTLSGMTIRWSVCGIGLNVNQPEWRSDAPNPVSLRELRGSECNLADVELKLRQAIMDFCNIYLHDPSSHERLHTIYMSRLWRGTGVYEWTDTLSGEVFKASIQSVAPTGHLTLKVDDGSERTYAFKEIAAIL